MRRDTDAGTEMLSEFTFGLVRLKANHPVVFSLELSGLPNKESQYMIWCDHPRAILNFLKCEWYQFGWRRKPYLNADSLTTTWCSLDQSSLLQGFSYGLYSTNIFHLYAVPHTRRIQEERPSLRSLYSVYTILCHESS